MKTYDFNDTNGPVPAHKHPKGGGWVADTAKVADTAYVGPDAKVYDNAQVYDHAQISGNAQVFGIAQVYDHANVFDHAQVYGHVYVTDRAWVGDNAQVYDYANVSDHAQVFGHAQVSGHAEVSDHVEVYDHARVYEHAKVSDHAQVFGNAQISGHAFVRDKTGVGDNAQVYDYANVSDHAQIVGDARVYGDTKVCGDAKVSAKELYFKTEPGGRVAFGKLDKEQEQVFLTHLKNGSDAYSDLFEIVADYDNDLFRCEGVANFGEEGDDGNEGLIEFYGPSVEASKEDGYYLVWLSLSKVSEQFTLVVDDYDPEKLSEMSIPIRLPREIEHDLYGHPDFNIVSHYRYDGEDIEESWDSELTDRGYDDLMAVIEVKSGKQKVVYSGYNGEGGNLN